MNNFGDTASLVATAGWARRTAGQLPVSHLRRVSAGLGDGDPVLDLRYVRAATSTSTGSRSAAATP